MQLTLVHHAFLPFCFKGLLVIAQQIQLLMVLVIAQFVQYLIVPIVLIQIFVAIAHLARLSEIIPA